MNELAQATMPLLYWLRDIRLPVFNTLLGALTFLGDETLFIVVGLAIYWCFSKRGGYYMITMGVLGTGISQFLKMLFRVPRPWVLDEQFEIVESAREGASGWSFPSGHTQIAVGTYGGLALWTEKKWLKIVGICLAVIIAFSRMYLGVHTILDVGVAALIALLIALLLRPTFKQGDARAVRKVLIGTLVICALLLAAVHLVQFPTNLNAEDSANLSGGIRNLWLLTGAALGLWICFEVDEKYLHFDTKAVWWVQLVKFAGGLLLVLGLKTGLQKLFGKGNVATLLIYLAMILVAGCVWPMAFKPLAAWGERVKGKKA